MNIVFTGEGIVSAIGLNKAQTLSSLMEKRSGIGTMRHLRSSHKELPVGEVPLSNGEMRRMFGLVEGGEISRSVLLGIMAVNQALTEAKITRKRQCRIVLIVGATVGGMDVTELHTADIEQPAGLESLKYYDCGASTGRIADYFGLFSDYTTVSTACSSAANALMLGAEMLRAGEADIVVAGGTEPLSLFHLNGFNSLMILDNEPCRPFDDTRAGLNLGEGAAFLVMESEESALGRGCPVHGYLTGWGNACDAFHQTASSDNGEGAYLAMTQALQSAGLRPGDIQYVNAHGTGTPNNDMSETMALQRVFGERMPRVSSTKSFTGHTTSASGAIEAVICLLAIEHGFVPANLRWEHQMPGGIVPSAGESGVVLDNVLCNSFGFGGNDTSLIISRRASVPETCPAGTCIKGALPDHRNAVVVARSEINSEEQLAGIRKYFTPIEARRMGKMLKASLLTSLQVLEEAGIQRPDAIITATAFGSIENSEKILMQFRDEGETMLSPTLFMLSTHNTIGGSIAVKTNCHGYNMTYTQGERSLDWALRDARRLLKTGRCRTVLVECHDESTPLFRSLMARLGHNDIPTVHSLSFLLTC